MINDYLTVKEEKKTISTYTWVVELLYEKLFDFINNKQQTYSAHKVGYCLVTTAEAGVLPY